MAASSSAESSTFASLDQSDLGLLGGYLVVSGIFVVLPMRELGAASLKRRANVA